MFNNVGRKLKIIASVLFVIELITIAIVFVVFLLKHEFLVALGILVIGVLSSWLSNAVLFAIGDIAETADNLRADNCKLEKKIIELQDTQKKIAKVVIVTQKALTNEIEKIKE